MLSAGRDERGREYTCTCPLGIVQRIFHSQLTQTFDEAMLVWSLTRWSRSTLVFGLALVSQCGSLDESAPELEGAPDTLF